MRKVIVSLSLALLLSACEEQKYSTPASLEYSFSFETRSWPSSIVTNPANGDVYVLCIRHSLSNPVSEVQKFSKNGEFVNTLVDFYSFEGGSHLSYIPFDITLGDHQNLNVLVRPRADPDPNEPGNHPTGFNILSFNPDGSFLDELDFSDIDGETRPSSIAYTNGYLFVTNGLTLKKISLETRQITETTLPPISYDTFFHHLIVSDMEINSDGIVYFTGPDLLYNDSVGCQVGVYNTQSNELTIFYGNSWTGWFGARVNDPGLSIHSNGDVYLATFYNRSIEVYNRNMEFILEKEINETGYENPSPIDIATFNEDVYVLDHRNDQVHVY
ncbi:MAG: hypothetical protein KAT15_16445, partial [Bacteroidales bacterium]|nr:hypothetical protein [Bacteroidales bacterium]